MNNTSNILPNFDRLKLEQKNQLASCEERIDNWNKFKKDYEVLKNRLETLPHEIKYDIMVPVSKMGFMPGRLVHTNEILVLLGDNWFVEKSAKQACDLIDRRVNVLDKYLEDLNKEKTVILDQLNWTENIMKYLIIKGKKEYVNIEEKIDDNKTALSQIKSSQTKKKLSDSEIKEMRKKLQEKALKIQNEINQEIKATEFKTSAKNEEQDESDEWEEDDEEYNERKKQANSDNFLEMLEKNIKELDVGEKFPSEGEFLEIKQDDNFKDMLKEYEKNIDRDNNKSIMEALEQTLGSKRQTLSNGESKKKSVKWSDVDNNESKNNDEDDEGVEEYDYDDEDDYDDEEELDSDDNDANEKDEIRNKADSSTFFIKIKHTKNATLDEIDHRLKTSRVKPSLNSPGDVYNVFYKPKSILKQTSSEHIDADDEQSKHLSMINCGKDNNREEISSKSETKEKFEPEKAFSGQIVERNIERIAIVSSSTPSSSTTSTEEIQPKKVSKFKASKKT